MAMSIEKKVGLFFLLALVVLGGMIELVEDWRPFETQNDYRTYFNSAVGIKVGDPVRMAGVEVGKIRAIGIDDGRVRIDFFVADGTMVKVDAVAEVRQTNLLGGQFLGLTFGTPAAAELPPGSEVASRDGANIDQLITSFDRNQKRVLSALGDLVEETRDPLAAAARQIESVVRKIDQGEGSLGRLVNDPSLYDDVQAAAADLKAVLARLEQGEGTLGRLLNDPVLYDEAKDTMANLRLITDRVRQGEGTVGRLFAEDVIYDDAAAAVADLRDITAKANSGEGTLGKLINDDALYDETHGAFARLRSVATKIDEGEGTLGRLVNEEDIYRDAKTTLNKVEKAVDGMRDQGPLSALGVVLGTLF